MSKQLHITLAIALLLSMVGLGLITSPTTVQAIGGGQPPRPDHSVTCTGNLQITIDVFSPVPETYFIRGEGPNLPSGMVYADAGHQTITFVISGPGTWDRLEVISKGPRSHPRKIRSENMSCVSVPTDPGPGPDMVEIPSQAVVGTVLATTPVYYAPNTDAVSDTVIEAGKTLWVYGLDANGQYYRIMLSGKYFWLPVSIMGPNYEEPWHGCPLPTEVVE